MTMNKTFVIFNLLAISIYSIAKPIDEETTAGIEDSNLKIDDQTLRPPDETEDVLPVLISKDDVISSSDLNKVYSSIENKFAKTRLLKDDTEDITQSFKNVPLNLEVEHPAGESTSVKQSDDQPEEKIETTEAEETGAVRTVENKSTERSSAEEKLGGDKQETRSAVTSKTVKKSKSSAKEESKTVKKEEHTPKIDNESKTSKTEESESIEATSEVNHLEKTATSFRRHVIDSGYLDNTEDGIVDRVDPDEKFDRKGYEMATNDESNSSWDVLDDIPASRRMLSKPDDMNIEVKAKSGMQNVKTVEERKVPTPKLTPTKQILYGSPTTPLVPIPQYRPTASVPYIHSTWLPSRRFIVPGFVRPLSAVNVDYRRMLAPQRNNIINQHIQHEPRSENNNAMIQNRNIATDAEERLEIPPSKKFTEDDNSENMSNAYPYTPNVLAVPKQQASGISPLMTKLIEASENPKRFLNPNVNVGNAQNFLNIPYNNKNNFYPNNGGNVPNYPGLPYNFLGPNNYAVPQNYGIYKFGT